MTQVSNQATDVANHINAAKTHADAIQANTKASLPVKTTARVFRSAMASVSYTFKNGKRANFVGGRYVTDIAHEIAELDAEIELHHPTFSSKPEETVEVTEPLAALRERFFEEFKAQEAALAARDKNTGASTVGSLNVLNSTHVADAMAGSNSGATGDAGVGANAAPAPAPKIAISLPTK